MVVLVVFVCVSLRGTDMGLLYVPKGMCVCVQLGVYASPRYVTIHPPRPPTHPNPKVCVCVYSWECMQVQGMLPSTHPTHPPTPTQRYACVCVQMSPQKHVVCTDESNLCAQMSPHPFNWAAPWSQAREQIGESKRSRLQILYALPKLASLFCFSRVVALFQACSPGRVGGSGDSSRSSSSTFCASWRPVPFASPQGSSGTFLGHCGTPKLLKLVDTHLAKATNVCPSGEAHFLTDW